MMRKTYRLVVFDWEGTLGDTLGPVIHALILAAQQLQFCELDERTVRRYVSLGLPLAVKKLFPQLTSTQHGQLLSLVQQQLALPPSDIYLMPGVRPLVQQLQEAGIVLGIASNKGLHSLQRALQLSGLESFFPVIRTASQLPAKPSPLMLEEIMAVYGESAAQTLMVGDSVADIEMAHQINVDALGVDFYHQQDADLLAAGALDVFDDYDNLARYLQLPEG